MRNCRLRLHGEIRRAVIERHPQALKLIGICDTNENVCAKISGVPTFSRYAFGNQDRYSFCLHA